MVLKENATLESFRIHAFISLCACIMLINLPISNEISGVQAIKHSSFTRDDGTMQAKFSEKIFL